MPLALVKLLVLSYDCDWDAACGHGEDVPYKGVGSCEGYFIVSIVVGGLAAETRTDDQVEPVGSPVINPLFPQMVSSSNFL